MYGTLKSGGLQRGTQDIGVQSPKLEAGGHSTAVSRTMWWEGGEEEGLDVEAGRTGGEGAASGWGAHQGGTLSRAASMSQNTKSFSGSSLSLILACSEYWFHT